MVSQKQSMRGGGKDMAERRAEAQRETQALAGDLRNSTHTFARSLKQSPLTPDNLEKIQSDR